MQMHAATHPDDRAITFGPFSVYPKRHAAQGWLAGPLGGRAFGILVALLEQAGEQVTKDQLIAQTWPNRVVEDSICGYRWPCCAKYWMADGTGPSTWSLCPVGATGSAQRPHVCSPGMMHRPGDPWCGAWAVQLGARMSASDWKRT